MANMQRDDTRLFPILQGPVLGGVARMAAEAEDAGEGHLIEFKAMRVRSILNKTVSKRGLWMMYSINPYRGCEFGCRYCYARYTHTFLQPSEQEGGDLRLSEADSTIRLNDKQIDYNNPDVFERRIFIKQNAAWLLEQELRRVRTEEQIALGTATDPYQPVERRALVTRSILEVFARQRGLRLGIVTKSNLIVRDIDLLQEIAARNTLTLHLTITTPDTELARKLEPRAPRPDLRFAAVAALRKAGLRAGILNCPLLPGITDNAVAMGEMARRAKEVDACFLAANPLFLKPCSRPTYFAFVQEHFPELMADMARRFANRDFAEKSYARRMKDILAAVCRKHGVGERRFEDALPGSDEARKPVARETVPVQYRLFG